MNKEFHNRLSQYARQNNATDANVLILTELGRIIVRNRKDFIDLLSECNIPANNSMSDNELVDLYIKNVDNQQLLVGTALLVNLRNRSMGADGTAEVSDEGVKTCYDALRYNFSSEEAVSNAGGFGEIAQGAIGLGKKIVEGQQKKKYGAQDILTEKAKAKSALIKSIAAEKTAAAKKAAADSAHKQKMQKYILIGGLSLVGVAIIVGTVIYIRKNKAK